MTTPSEVPAIVETVVRYECPKRGNNCRVPYVPKTMRAAEAIKANPEKSNRAIAAEIGADEKTVRKAREATADQSAVQERIGLDGKTRKLPAQVKVNGQSMDIGRLGPAAQEQIAAAIAPEEYTAAAERGLLNIARGIEPCNPETWCGAEKPLADRLDEICDHAWNICQDKSNWSPAVTEHEWKERIARHMRAMRSSFESLSKIARKSSERQAKIAAKVAARRKAA
jgi:hypothetical protein